MTLIPRTPSAPYPPPDGYSYREPKTGRFFNGLEGNVEVTARKIIEFRLANPHIFPEGGGDLGSTIQQIYQQKYATHPHLFLGGPDAPGTPASQPSTSNVCSCGSTEWSPVYCTAGCAPGRIVGYKCSKCGKQQ